MKTKTIFFTAILLGFLACDAPKEDKKKATLEASFVNLEITTPSSTSTFLSLSDVHLNSGNSNTFLSNKNGGSDTGDNLWLRTKEKINAVVKDNDPKFMVYLGDLPTHNDLQRTTNITTMLDDLGELHKNIKIPILYLPGNNDSVEGDYHSFQNTDGENLFSKDTNKTDNWPILNKYSSSTKITLDHFNKQFGFYAANINIGNDSLKVIALNTVIFCHKGGHLYYVGDDDVSQQDAARKQLKWLATTLKSYKKTDRVLIMMHIPPGIDDFSKHKSNNGMWNNSLKYKDTTSIQTAFLNQIKDHKDQIVGVLTGHTHLDGLRRLYASNTSDNKDDLVGISISTPGITPGHGNNPGFKLFTYEKSTFNLLDFETFYAVPTENEYTDFKYQDASYTFKETYKPTKKTNETMFSVIKGMDSSTIIENMGNILYVKSKIKTLKHRSSLNVTYKQLKIKE